MLTGELATPSRGEAEHRQGLALHSCVSNQEDGLHNHLPQHRAQWSFWAGGHNKRQDLPRQDGDELGTFGSLH